MAFILQISNHMLHMKEPANFTDLIDHALVHRFKF